MEAGMMGRYLLILAPFLLFANGGPVETSALLGSGNLRLIQKKDINLEAETINLSLYGDYVNVRVKYRFANNGQAAEVTYAFPVDYSTDFELNGRDYGKTWEEVYIPYLKISDEKGELPLERLQNEDSVVLDFSFLRDTVYTWLYNFEGGIKGLRRWYVARVTFPAYCQKTITVSYRVKSIVSDSYNTKSVYNMYSDRLFYYDLSPSGAWGDGVVKEFKVILDARRNLARSAELKRASLPGKPEVENGIYTYQASNLNLSQAGAIKVAYDNTVENESKEIVRRRIDEDWIASIKSSEGSEGEYDNLFDLDFGTSWKCGKGDWIEVRLDTHALIRGVGIIGGNTASEGAYYDYPRIKKLKIEVWSSYYEDYQGEREVVESVGATTENIIRMTLLGEGEFKRAGKIENILVFEDKEFSNFNKDAFEPFMELLFSRNVGFYDLCNLKITVLDVYPGKKYDDVCASELFIMGYWKKG